MAISDSLRELLGKPRIEQAKQYEPVQPVYRNTHKAYAMPMDNDAWYSGFCKMYEAIWERPYEPCDESKRLVMHFNQADMNKGALVMGKPGNGKTTIMQTLSRLLTYTDQPRFDVYYVPVIVNNFSKHGAIAIDECIRRPACIDDIGAEVSAMHYGLKLNMSQELIEKRYVNNVLTHYTTNLMPEELREYVGERAYDRLKKQCELFVFKSDSKR